MKLLRPFFALGAVFALLAACGGSDGDPATNAGIALTVKTDGTVTPDRLSLRVTSGSTVVLGTDLAIGTTTTLPRTVNVDASGTATVVVKAWQGSTPLDRRDLVVGPLPTTGYAPVTITLTSKCTPRVRAEGSDIVSDCAAGSTCNADDGTCGNAQVTPTTVCTPGATTCADGQSTQKCKADGSGYEAATSCNGKTCANDACTTCNIGDESCGTTTKCTLGTSRCGAGKMLQRCQADGTFKDFDECDFVCRDNDCAGECTPGASRCCITYGDGTKDCNGPGSSEAEVVCIAGSACPPKPKPPTGVQIETCSNSYAWVAGQPCTTNCTPGEFSGKTTVGCGFCSGAGGGNVATCLEACICAN